MASFKRFVNPICFTGIWSRVFRAVWHNECNSRFRALSSHLMEGVVRSLMRRDTPSASCVQVLFSDQLHWVNSWQRKRSDV